MPCSWTVSNQIKDNYERRIKTGKKRARRSESENDVRCDNAALRLLPKSFNGSSEWPLKVTNCNANDSRIHSNIRILNEVALEWTGAMTTFVMRPNRKFEKKPRFNI